MSGFYFLDSEAPRNNPFQYLRIGTITKVIDDIGEDYNIKNYFTLLVEWLDRGGTSGSVKSNSANIKLTYPHISRGWGLQYKPSVGDTIICGFRMGGYPVLIGFWSLSYYKKVKRVADENTTTKLAGSESYQESGYYFRNIDSGEYCWKSKKGAEWYLDKKGSLRLIVRNQEEGNQVVIEDTANNIRDEIVKDEPLVEVTVGQVYNSDFSSEVLSGYDNSIRFQINDKKKGTKITIDTEGNIEISNNGELILGSGATKGVAREEDSTKSTSAEDSIYWSWLSGFISTFQSWVPVPLDGGASLKTALTVYLATHPTPSSLTGKIITSSETVKAKD